VALGLQFVDHSFNSQFCTASLGTLFTPMCLCTLYHGGWPEKQRPLWQSLVSAEARSNRPIAQPR